MNYGVFALGVVLLLIGVLAYGYTVIDTHTYFFGAYSDTNSKHPYESYGMPFVVLGFVFMFIGLIVPGVRTTREHTVIEETPTHMSKHTRTVIEEED